MSDGTLLEVVIFLRLFALAEKNIWHFSLQTFSWKEENAPCHRCCPQCNTPRAFPSPKLHILSSSSLSPLKELACFSFAELKGAICVLLCLPPARDCLRCFPAAALLLMEAKPAYNSLWQVIQTHNIKIRSSHWSSQLKKPPQAIARRLLAVAAEFRRLKIHLLLCGEIPGYFVETVRITNGQTIESVVLAFFFVFTSSVFPRLYINYF